MAIFVIGLKSNLNHLFIIGKSLTTKLSVVKATTLLNKINITTYFEKQTMELHILYTLNTYVKFCVNRIIFNI